MDTLQLDTSWAKKNRKSLLVNDDNDIDYSDGWVWEF